MLRQDVGQFILGILSHGSSLCTVVQLPSDIASLAPMSKRVSDVTPRRNTPPALEEKLTVSKTTNCHTDSEAAPSSC